MAIILTQRVPHSGEFPGEAVSRIDGAAVTHWSGGGPGNGQADFTLALTAADRTRSRHRFTTLEGETAWLQLPRGTVLQDGDWLTGEMDGPVIDGPVIGGPVIGGDSQVRLVWVQVVAKPEPVLTVMAKTPLALLQAAYHLGNRHVPLEVTPTYLRLAPDSVLRDLLVQRGLTVEESLQPFRPEPGAYDGHRHAGAPVAHEHAHESAHEHAHEQAAAQAAGHLPGVDHA